MNSQSSKSVLLLKADADLRPTTIAVEGYFYLVDFGEGVSPRIHKVGKNKRCTCYLGKHCPAVDEVADYLKAGGERAPDPPSGYYPVIPACCPICGAEVESDPALSSRKRGVGWRCLNGGKTHYWQRMAQALHTQTEQNPWIIPPVVDGVQAVYPGVHKDDLATLDNNPYAFEDYNPYA